MAGTGTTAQYYPLVFSTFWIEHHIWAEKATAYHLTNVLLQSLNACLIWRILRNLGIREAWLAAAIFALHPVHVESVAWVTERKNVLSGVLYLSAMLAYLRFTVSRDRRWYMVASAAFIGALLSKTVTCTLPAALILLCWWRQDRVSRRDWLFLTPWFAIGIGFGILTAWLEKHYVGANGPDWELTITKGV